METHPNTLMYRQEFLDRAAIAAMAALAPGDGVEDAAEWACDHAEALWEQREKRRKALKARMEGQA